MGRIINLSKDYYSIYGKPVINRVDLDIFKYRYFSECLKSQFCNDICCSYGADIDIENVERLKKHRDNLEKLTGVGYEEWFKKEFFIDEEFPGGKYTRTETKDGRCLFLNRKGRGCLIHSYCLENNIDYHILKSMVGVLFPITFESGLLRPSNEVIDNSLCCLFKGETTLFDGVKNEIIYYFGNEIIEELESIRKEL